MDVAFVINPANGKLTFARNARGDFYLDNRAVYSVFATLSAEKGRYAHSSTYGTYLGAILKDNRATGTRLTGAATDAFEQLRQAGIISNGSARPERLRVGSWALALNWKTPKGSEQRETVRF